MQFNRRSRRGASCRSSLGGSPGWRGSTSMRWCER